MTLEEVQKAINNGEAQFTETETETQSEPVNFDDFAKYTAFLEVLRKPKYHLTSAPTFTPKNFLEQIQFFDDGADQRIYFYVNGSWYYTALTS